jgi:hypothetical protein
MKILLLSDIHSKYRSIDTRGLSTEIWTVIVHLESSDLSDRLRVRPGKKVPADGVVLKDMRQDNREQGPKEQECHVVFTEGFSIRLTTAKAAALLRRARTWRPAPLPRSQAEWA